MTQAARLKSLRLSENRQWRQEADGHNIGITVLDARPSSEDSRDFQMGTLVTFNVYFHFDYPQILLESGVATMQRFRLEKSPLGFYHTEDTE